MLVKISNIIINTDEIKIVESISLGDTPCIVVRSVDESDHIAIYETLPDRDTAIDKLSKLLDMPCC